MFPSEGASAGHLESLKKAFARCAIAAGLREVVKDEKGQPRKTKKGEPIYRATVTPHTMRHTAITRMARTGADIRTVQEFSGHETLEMVMRYTHAQDEAVDQALDLMETGGTPSEQRSDKKSEKS